MAESYYYICGQLKKQQPYLHFLKQLVFVGRLSVLLVAIIAIFLAYDRDSSILSLVSNAWAGFGAAFGPVIVLSLYWKRMNRNGALAGILIGGITIVVWKQLSGGIFELYEIVPGIICATVAIVVASLATKEPEQAVIERYELFERNLKTFD